MGVGAAIASCNVSANVVLLLVVCPKTMRHVELSPKVRGVGIFQRKPNQEIQGLSCLLTSPAGWCSRSAEITCSWGNTLFERWTNSSRFISEFALIASLQDELQISPGSWDHFRLCV